MKRNAFGQLGAQFAPAYHRPFLRYFDGEKRGRRRRWQRRRV